MTPDQVSHGVLVVTVPRDAVDDAIATISPHVGQERPRSPSATFNVAAVSTSGPARRFAHIPGVRQSAALVTLRREGSHGDRGVGHRTA